MSLKKFPELHSFFITYLAEADTDNDEKVIQSFLAASSADKQQQVLSQLKSLNQLGDALVDELGMEVNRWFADLSEAQDWIKKIAGLMEASTGQTPDQIVVKDSNGAVLSEGDAVTVIKDLKVKGGSSDLKRGTLVKKIHLINDPDNIECNVNGSTLVLKTIFLKKA